MADDKTGAAATSEGAAGDKTGTGTGATPAAGTGAQTPEQKAAADAAAKTAADKAAADAAAKAAAEKTGTGAEGKTGSTDDKAGKADESKAPEKYDLKVPEAGSPFINAGGLERLEKMAREAGWTNEEAQAALDEHVTVAEAVLKKQTEGFLAETKANKTYGGDHYEETVRLAKSVVDKIRPVGHAMREDFLRFMASGGADNNLQVLAFLADLGKAMGEDSPVFTRTANQGGGDAASKLYDHPTSKVSG